MSLPLGGLTVEGVAEVVLHVAPAHVGLRVLVLEAGEDLPNVHLHDVDHDVEPPTVGHADDHLLDAELGRALGEVCRASGSRTFTAFEREALGARVLRVQELLEDLGVGELGEDANLLLATEVDVIARVLSMRVAATNPCASRLSRNVCSTPMVREYVSLSRAIDRLAATPWRVQRSRPSKRSWSGSTCARARSASRGTRPGADFPIEAERIQIGEQMSTHSVRVDQRGETCLQLGRRQHLR